MSSRLGARGLTYGVLGLMTVVLLYPIWFMARTSFQSIDQFQAGGGGFTVVSWHRLFAQLPVWRELYNSTLISVSAVTIILVVSTMAGRASGMMMRRKMRP